MILNIRHTGLVVNDLEGALHFWQNLLGFKVEQRMEEFGPEIDAMMGLTKAHLTTVKLVAPEGGKLEILHFNSHPDIPKWLGSPYSTGYTHIALTVKNLDDLYHQLTQASFSFPAAPQFSKDGLVKVIYCIGPEGILIEFVELI